MNYNEDSQELTVEFVSGLVYIYKQVPLETFEAMKNSGAKGIYLNKYIKGRYEYVKIS